ncbi:hypothetical protein KEJ26_04090 [Candidatus Bathyarchaeota archaeon]|nr:hypothetical protein [Candidatus Bathyarchaeota archaeon]
MPVETAEFGFEIVVWLTLGVVLLTCSINTGNYLLKWNARLQLTYVTEGIVETINIVGSRRVKICIEMPGMTERSAYTVQIQGKTVTAKTDDLTISQNAMFNTRECTLYPGRSYIVTFQEDQVVFMEGAL